MENERYLGMENERYLGMENGRADAGRDGRTRLARPSAQGANGDREKYIFPVQLTTSKIGNLTRLIYTLLYVMVIYTCIHTYILYCTVLNNEYCIRYVVLI